MRTSSDRNLVPVPAGILPARAFTDAIAAETDIPAILRPVIARLSKHHHAIDDNGRLILSLARTHLSSAGILIEEVRKNPELKSHILFYDGIDRRGYDDVVWDLEKNPNAFLNIVNMEQGRTQPVRVLITPKIKGPGDGNVINAADIKFNAPLREGLTLAVRLYTHFNGEAVPDRNAARLIGRQMIVQTDRMAVTGILEKDKTMTMHIAAQQPCMRVYDAGKPVLAGIDCTV